MEYFVLDLETTNLSPQTGEITEISILRCRDLRQKTWHIKIKKPQNCNPRSLAITGKTLTYLMNNGKYLEDVIDEITAFIEEDGATPATRTFIAHNAGFDQRFVEYYWAQNNKTFPCHLWLCTMLMSKRFIKLRGYETGANLEEVLYKFKIKGETEKHESGADVRNTFRVHQYLIKQGMNPLEFTKQSKNTTEMLTSKIISTDEDIEEIMKAGYDFGNE